MKSPENETFSPTKSLPTSSPTDHTHARRFRPSRRSHICLLYISRIPCHFAQIRSYRTSVQEPELRLSAVITIEEFPKSGSGLFLKKQLQALFHACAATHRPKKAVRNDMEYGIPVPIAVSPFGSIGCWGPFVQHWYHRLFQP